MSHGEGGGGQKSPQKVSRIIWMGPKISRLISLIVQISSLENPKIKKYGKTCSLCIKFEWQFELKLETFDFPVSQAYGGLNVFNIGFDHQPTFVGSNYFVLYFKYSTYDVNQKYVDKQ